MSIIKRNTARNADKEALLIKNTNLFAPLSDLEIPQILNISTKNSYVKDTVLFKEGSQGDKFYLIIKGKVRISKFIKDIGEEALAILSSGEYFGEMALIDQSPRSATAIIHEDALLLEITHQDFFRLLQRDSILAFKVLWSFAKTLCLRLRDTDAKVRDLSLMASPF